MEETENTLVPPPSVVGALDPYEARSILEENSITNLLDIRLVDYLVQDNKIDKEKLLQTISEAKTTSEQLKTILHLNNVISEKDILRAEAELNDLPIVILGEVEIEKGLADLIEPFQASEWECFPFSRSDIGELYVVTCNPDNLMGKESISHLLKDEEIVFFLASEREFLLYLDKLYDSSSDALEATLDDEEVNINFTVNDDAITAPVIKLVEDLIDKARELGASDIHIEPREETTLVRLRIDGMLRDLMPIKTVWHKQVIARLKTLSGMRTDISRVPQSGRITLKGKHPLSLRVETTPTVYGEMTVMRLLDPMSAMISLDTLGMDEDSMSRYFNSINSPNGVALITGPTGSGKSTTLYSSMNSVMTEEKKLITVEDPVEYHLSGITQIDVSSAGRMGAGASGKLVTFESALRSILRLDPDIIMVGEIRDHATAQIAMEAALTGHFLFSTLHTNSALQAITRLSELQIAPFLVGNALEVVVAQRLPRRLCKICKEEYQINADFLRKIDAPQNTIEALAGGKTKILYKPSKEGCANCGGSGYKGRTGIYEVVPISEEMREKIVLNASLPDLERQARKEGVPPLIENAFFKIWKGETSIEEIERVAK